MQIGRRLYFDKLTGEVIKDTGERSGNVFETTVEQEIEIFKVLSERNRSTFDVISLEYGQFAQDFKTCNGYRVNVDTLQVEFSYPDPNEPEVQQEYRDPISEETKVQNESLSERVEFVEDAVNFLLLGGI